MPTQVNILVVDAREQDRKDLKEVLHTLPTTDYRILEARFGAEALRILLEEDIAVLFIGPELPDMTGPELAQVVRRRERTASMPIVFVTADGGSRSFIESATRINAVDYLGRPLVPELVRAKVAMYSELFRQRQTIRQHTDMETELGILELRLARLRRYRNLAEAVPNILWTAGTDGTVDYFNRRWFEYTGMSASAAENWTTAIHPDDLAARERTLARAIETGEAYEIEFRLRRVDGTYRWHLCRGVPDHGSASRTIGWLGSFTDIDDERRARAALAEFKGTLDAVMDAVMILETVDWRLVYANRGASALLGYTEQELIGMRPNDLLPGSAADYHELLTPLITGDKSTLTVEVDFRRRDGTTVPVELSLQVMRYNGGRVVAIARDISERIRTRQEREFLYHQTVDALRTRDEFISIASHELRSPLAALELQIDMLMEPPRRDPTAVVSPDELKQKLQVASRQVDRMTRLITELLDVTRITGGRLRLERTAVDLTAVAHDVIERFAADAAKAHCTVTLEDHASVTGIWDRLRIEQVLTNLLTNAFKFGAGKPVEIAVAQHGPSARLSVTDHGVGIPPEDTERIFNRFEQARSKQSYAGLGLGLYIVRGIVEAHGGTVRVESEPNVRTSFIVELPRQPTFEAEEAESSAPHAHSHH